MQTVGEYQFKIADVVGQGGFGRVYKGQAIKVTEKDDYFVSDPKGLVRREANAPRNSQ